MEAKNYIFDVKKYFDYFFETKGFKESFESGEISDHTLRAARLARGMDRKPAIFIHGVMPRSGTVYIGELLRLHQDLFAYPHQLWEFPALQLAGDVRTLQNKFLLAYKQNKEKLKKNDFLPLIGSALIAYLYEPVPENQRVLVKMPSVQYLDCFPAMFPFENLLILVRDGRDLVHSTLRTWPRLNFIQVCLRWNRSAQMVLKSSQMLSSSNRKDFWLVKYEDALLEPGQFVKEACCRFGLDESRYPFEEIKDIRVIGSSKLGEKGKVTWRHLKKPKDFKPVEYWKKWSTVKKMVFKALAGRSLIELGYSKDHNW